MSGVLRVTILGCGSSGGVPRADGDWGACDPNEPRNRRSRCGLLLQKWRGAVTTGAEATTVLIDTPPDMREQLIRAHVRHVDAVIYSHDHADQSHGIDDLRAFVIRMRRRMPIWMDESTRRTLVPRFHYCFSGQGGYPAILEQAGDLQPGKVVAIEGPGGALPIMPLLQDHGQSLSLGFRFGAAAYSNDVVDMPAETFAALEGLDLWIVDALRKTPHPTHAHLARSLEWIERLRPRRAMLTNMHVDLDYQRLRTELPSGVEPAYDGWSTDIDL